MFLYTPCGNSMQKLVAKRYIKRTYLRFSTNYSIFVIKIYCTFQIEKIINHKNFAIFSFL